MKGQVVLFIIVGILVVMALAFTLYATSTLKKSGLPKSKGAIEDINNLVSVCLAKVGEEGLYALGQQGFLNESEWLVLPPQGSIGVRSSDVPAYPFPGFPYFNGSLLFTGYYGVSVLPPLYGPNDNSVERLLTSFVESRIVGCADWQSFGNQATVSAGVPHVALGIARAPEDFQSETAITLQLDWPLNVTTSDGQMVPMGSFAARLPVRLASVYYIAKGLLDADVSDVSYVPSVPSGLVLEKSLVENGSFLKLKDKQSLLDSVPFEVVLSRKNRNPALWEINASSLSGKLFHITPDGRGALVSVQGSSLVIDDPCPDGVNPFVVGLNASDPDDDAVVFEVSVPGSSDQRLPASAVGVPYQITVFAKDSVGADFQNISLQVVLCEVR